MYSEQISYSQECRILKRITDSNYYPSMYTQFVSYAELLDTRIEQEEAEKGQYVGMLQSLDTSYSFCFD
jgi:hypothetical protein